MTLRPRFLPPTLVLLCVALLLPVAAHADQPDDVRRQGRCTGASEISLRLRSDDGVIRVELEVETQRRASRWSVVLLHERRIAFRGVLRSRPGDGDVRLRRTVPDLYGTDSFAARATSPRGETCRVSAAI